MPKRATPIKRTTISLDQNAATPLYRQLYERLRAEILEQQLEAGARLPSTRALASELGVSRNTTALAYEMLLMEGYIESKVGHGTRVAQMRSESLREQTPGGKASTLPQTPPTAPRLLSRRGQLLLNTPHAGEMYVNLAEKEASIFRAGQPDMAAFPYEVWARLMARHARHSLRTAPHYQHTTGYAPLREAIARHIGITRGVYCSPEQIILTAGSQGALDLTARVLLDPGDAAWVEHPGYPGARGALLAAGAELIPVPVDREGLDIAAGLKLRPDARLAAVTPSHQFPTGVTMSLSRRLALLAWAREAEAWILEDDYDSEFRFSGRPLEALQGLDKARRVIYIGTFSKVLFPALRLGYLVAPVELIEGLSAARHFIDVHPPLLEQMALADFIAEGHFTRHLRRMRTLYLERRNALIDALKEELGDVLDITVPEAGIHLLAWLPPGLSSREVAAQAARHSLDIAPIPLADQASSRGDGIMLAYAGGEPAELRAGVHRLARALRSLL
jgi:GntR family transcriptional regulator/MocR family aminotransferase